MFVSWAAAVAEGSEYRAEFRWVHPDGAIAWVDVLGRPEFDDDGKILGFIGVTLDITERRGVETVLAEREEQLTLLASNATDAVFRIALDGHCLYASPSATELLGIEHTHLVGVQMLDRFHPDDEPRLMEAFAAFRNGDRDRKILAYRSRRIGDRGYRWLEANCGLVCDAASGEPVEVIASIRDISQSKALEAELIDARATAETGTAAKTAFLANMSHEIRTPMNGVLGFTELLLETDLDQTQKTYLSLIADSGRAMMKLLNDILDVSKIESRELVITSEPFDLRHVLRGSLQLIVPTAHAKGLVLEIEVSPDLPTNLLGDPLRLRQIMLNLIGNAAKFTQAGTIRVAAALSGETPRRVEITVQDTGIGIAANQLDLIFDKFAQADASIGRRFGGTGLGLSISRELAELMNGSLVVDSVEGEGTIFTLLLPFRSAAEAAPVDPAIAPEPRALPGPISSKPRVLVAEDHDVNRVLIDAMARSAGMEPTIVGDGAEAIAAVEQASAAGRPFALVLMDMQMPGVDGLAATRSIRRHGHLAETLPIVALTANARAEDIRACLDAGMQAHLAKPVRIRDLRDIMSRMLGAKPRDVERPAAGPSDADIVDAMRGRFQQRKDEAIAAAIAHASGHDVGPDDVQRVASLLHNLAGTAGMFDEADLGEAAATLEHLVRKAGTDTRCAELHLAVDRMKNAA